MVVATSRVDDALRGLAPPKFLTMSLGALAAAATPTQEVLQGFTHADPVVAAGGARLEFTQRNRGIPRGNTWDRGAAASPNTKGPAQGTLHGRDREVYRSS